MAVSLGIIGTGRIAERFVDEVPAVDGVRIAAVYNPHYESAKRFAEKHGIDIATDSFEELTEAVSAVYVASPHETHYGYTRKLLEADRHVLCEKPLCFDDEQAKELFALARTNGCVLMEAIKTACCPGFLALLQVAASGVIGRIVDVESAFSRLTPIHLRELQDTEYGGSFTELGSYVMLPIMKLLGTEYNDVVFRPIRGINDLDIFNKVGFEYNRTGKTGLGKVGLGAKTEGELIITGTDGYIVAQAPWWMTKHFEIRHENPNQIEYCDCPYEGSGLRYEIAEFADRIEMVRTIRQESRNAGAAATPVDIMMSWVGRPGVTPGESIAMAGVMKKHLELKKSKEGQWKSSWKNVEPEEVNIWAHRGLSSKYPENTLESFEAALKIPGLYGIELDVQLTSDNQIVVIHDETVDRTTSGTGGVRDYTLEALKKLEISGPDGMITHIPTLREVLELAAPYCREFGTKINIELKTSVIHYENIEEMTVRMVEEFELQDYVIYSSFWAESLGRIIEAAPYARTGMLAPTIEACLYEMRRLGIDDAHPYIGGLTAPLPPDMKGGRAAVRAYNGEEPLYGTDRRLTLPDQRRFAEYGVTDIFTNLADEYLKDRK